MSDLSVFAMLALLEAVEPIIRKPPEPREPSIEGTPWELEAQKLLQESDDDPIEGEDGYYSDPAHDLEREEAESLNKRQ